MIIIFAVTSSVGPFAGQNYDAGRLDRVRAFSWMSDKFCIAYGLAAAALLMLLGRPLPATVLTSIKLFLGYIPTGWLFSWAAGLDGIFWANAIVHLAFGVVGYIWFQRILDRLDEDQLRRSRPADARSTA